MIPRYQLPEIAELFSDAAKYNAWLEVELRCVEAHAALGKIDDKTAKSLRSKASFSIPAIEAREQVTHHDVAAFVDVVQDSVGDESAGWIHFGLTSSDVVDTALSWIMVQALDLVLVRLAALEGTLARRAVEFSDTPMVGRTHGIFAEPTTFGTKLALWAMQVRRCSERLRRARETIAVGKLSGAVGTYSNIDPRVEELVCVALGLTPVPATQVIARDRHAEVVFALAEVAVTIEMMATEIRHLQRSEVAEVFEPFVTGKQKGSSAMPHKRNPVKCEQLCGLARVVRSNVQVALEDVALWHERDISHSSAERLIIPDSFQITYYMVVQANYIVAEMVINADRMRENLESTHGLVFSQGVLLALVEAGVDRDAAYRIVQRCAGEVAAQGIGLREALVADADANAALGHDGIEACFDLAYSLRHIDKIFDQL